MKQTSGCWQWTAATTSFGYGKLKVGDRLEGAHRYSWMLHIGQIPKGLCVLHRCDNPACVRPDHLFLGTKLENAIDCQSKGRNPRLAKRTHCPKGHEYTEANTIWYRRNGIVAGRNCRACGRAANKASSARRRAADPIAAREYSREQWQKWMAAHPNYDKIRKRKHHHPTN